MIDSTTVKQWGKECGADLVGIASAGRFRDVPGDENPRSIKPDAESVIVLAFRYLNGALQGIGNGSNWGAFSGADPAGMSAYMQEATYCFARRLESAGFEATPLIRHSYDLRNRGVPVSPGVSAPDVILNMEYAAYAAGLGEMGMGKLFLTPQFGPRQVFSAVLTELKLAEDPIFAGGLCKDCDECIRACPLRALDRDRVIAETYPSGTLRHWALLPESCQICKTGTSPRPYSLGLEPCRVGVACGRACNRHCMAVQKSGGPQ